MTNPLAQDLGGVVRLLEKATPGKWRAGFMHDGEFVESATDGGALQKGDGSFLAVSKTANGYNYQDAKAIAAAVNFLRTHSAEIAGALRDAEAWERRFTEMLIGVINDTQNALGFTDEEKECSNGSLEIVAKIRELQENAARYLWLRSRLAGKEHVAELIEYSDDLSSEVDAAIDSAMQQGGGGGDHA